MLTIIVGMGWSLLSACGSPDEFQGTYEQETPIPEDHEFAYKLDLFRFGNEVGGVVRFYELEGEGEARFNDRARPFVVESDCAFFGPVDLDRDTFVFSVEGAGAEEFIFRISSLDPDDIQAEVSRFVDQQVSETMTFSMGRSAASADRECTPPARTFDVLVDLPEVTVDEAPDLSLAVAFAGYELSEDGLDRRITRYGAVVNTVDRASDNTYQTRQRVILPEEPGDPRGLSDAGDGGVSYAVGYLVLFNDGNRDGAFFHNVRGDEVLALSATRVLLYVAGPPEGLDPSVQAIFEDVSEVQRGYGIYAVETELQGDNAYIRSALPLRGDVGIRLEPIGVDNPRVFPALLPE